MSEQPVEVRERGYDRAREVYANAEGLGVSAAIEAVWDAGLAAGRAAAAADLRSLAGRMEERANEADAPADGYAMDEFAADLRRIADEGSASERTEEKACSHDTVTVAGREYEHYDRLGPGCWHPIGGGRCRSWQALLDHAHSAGYVAGAACTKEEAGRA